MELDSKIANNNLNKKIMQFKSNKREEAISTSDRGFFFLFLVIR